MITRLTLVAALVFVLADDGHARSRAPVREFMATNPCPATGEIERRCPGYVVDHIWPLCGGGLDAPSNMQWQAIEESRRKDKAELDMCRWIREAKRKRR